MGTVAGVGTALPAPTDRQLEERVRELRRRVYGRDARPEDVAELMTLLAARRPAAPPAWPAGGTEPDDTTAPERPPEPVPPPTAASRVLAVLAAVPGRAVALVAGVAVAGAAVGAATTAIVGAPAPATAGATPRFTPMLELTADPAVLAHAAGAGDQPSALPGPELVGDSFRSLGQYPAAGVTFWAARDRMGEICLVAADVYFRTACADPATFAATGAVLTWSAGPGYPVSTTIGYAAVWRDGRLTAGPAFP